MAPVQNAVILTVDIKKFVTVPGGHLYGYYVVLGIRGGPPGVYVDTATLQTTPANAINEARQKLTANFQAGNQIEWRGAVLANVASAVTAIVNVQAQWQ